MVCTYQVGCDICGHTNRGGNIGGGIESWQY